MNKVEGLHHVAITTGDMKGQIEFFTDKLGMELVALYWMHGVENTFHGFLRMNDESSVAFVHNPDIAKIKPQLGVTHSGNPGANCVPGAMQHFAFNVKGHGELMALKDRLRSKGVPVIGPKDHGFCMSIYFAGPENLSLEFSYSTEPINADAWIDPEVVDLCGISAEDLARYRVSSDYQDQNGAVPQPGPDAPGPHMTNYPPRVYEAILKVSDDKMLANSENQPPVHVAAAE
jgi:catechol 2,3-dioxygenase-like lactoylglutathione lyase family enzyme